MAKSKRTFRTSAHSKSDPSRKAGDSGGAVVDGTRALTGLAWQPCSAVAEFAARCAAGVETALVSGPVRPAVISCSEIDVQIF